MSTDSNDSNKQNKPSESVNSVKKEYKKPVIESSGRLKELRMTSVSPEPSLPGPTPTPLEPSS